MTTPPPHRIQDQLEELEMKWDGWRARERSAFLAGVTAAMLNLSAPPEAETLAEANERLARLGAELWAIATGPEGFRP